MYLWRLEWRPAPVVFNHLLSLVDVFPGSLHGSTWWSSTDAAVSSASCDAAAPHDRVSQTFFTALLAPQQVVLGQNMPVVTCLWCPRQVTRLQIRQNIQCHLPRQQMQNRTLALSVKNASIIHKLSVYKLHFKLLTSMIQPRGNWRGPANPHSRGKLQAVPCLMLTSLVAFHWLVNLLLSNINRLTNQ